MKTLLATVALLGAVAADVGHVVALVERREGPDSERLGEVDDVVLGQVSISYLLLSGGNPEKALIADGFGDAHYALQFVVRADRKDDPEIAKFIAIYRSPEVKDYIAKKYGKFFVPVW